MTAMTDDARLLDVMLREEMAHPAWWIADNAGVDREYAMSALARMADWTPLDGDPSYPVQRRADLGSDVYESTEDSARSWR